MSKKWIIPIITITLFVSCSPQKHKLPQVRLFSQFQELPLTSVKPDGWLNHILIKQKDGLTGHLEEAGYPFDLKWWGNPEPGANTSIMKWWPYEQEGYWIDGMIRCGYLVNDSLLVTKAVEQIKYVLDHPDSTGYLGPKFMKPSVEGDRWAHAVFFRSVQALYNATGDKRILESLRNHFLGEKYYSIDTREMVNIETILFVYKHLGDKALLQFASELYSNFQKGKEGEAGTEKYFLNDEPASIHGVTYNELAKLGAIMFSFTGDTSQLNASVKAIDRIKKYHLMPDGVNVSCEKMRTPVHSLQGHETCDIADFTWTLSYLLMTTGNPEYADMIEKAIFNAAPSVVDSLFKAVQYFSSVNQVIADKSSCHTPQGMGSAAMSYRPNPYTECCPANVNRIFPNFASRMWLETSENTIVASLYAPSTIIWESGAQGKCVKIEEVTNYPFSDTISFKFTVHDPVEFSFGFRIPGWCKMPTVLMNGNMFKFVRSHSTYQTLNRKFKNGDKIDLVFPPEIAVHHSVDGGIWIERGPLVYSLAIDENWEVDSSDMKSSGSFPAYNLYAASKWNYAIGFDKSIPVENQMSIINRPVTDNPWTVHNSPICIELNAREVKGWEIIHRNTIEEEHWLPVKDQKGNVIDWRMEGHLLKKGNYNFTPPLPTPSILKEMVSPKTDRICLVPYGCTKLRITIFPNSLE